MRGLPFPAESTPFRREHSHEYSTYNSSTPTTPAPGIPDALLGMIPQNGVVGDPRLALPFDQNGFPGNAFHIGKELVHGSLEENPADATSIGFPHYLQGPQGDPFAPPPPFPNYVHTLNEQQTPADPRFLSKPQKRKRKPRREEDCGFCQGNDNHNRNGEPEQMVTCNECGRSGHPSCMELGNVGDVFLEYPWKCMECKTCEVCRAKGEDDKLMFCDHCDRGWHTYCLDPPLESIVDGTWHCPRCPPVSLDAALDAARLDPEPWNDQPQESEATMQIDPALQMEIDPALRESSVASSSKTQIASLVVSNGHAKRSRALRTPKPNGRNRALHYSDAEEILHEDDEVVNVDEGTDVDVEIDVDALVDECEADGEAPASRSKSRSRRSIQGMNHRRANGTAPSRHPNGIGDRASPPLSRPRKRVRTVIRSASPQENSRPKMMVRIKLPPGKDKGKGKARAEDMGTDEEAPGPRKGMFDDILVPEERDTAKTSVQSNDRDRFERSRVAADAKLNPLPPPELSDPNLLPVASSSRFPLRSATHQVFQQPLSSVSVVASPSPSTPGPSSYVPAKFDPAVLRIRTIRFGPYDIQTWYDAPFPEEFSNIPDGRLWICEFCLKYMKSRFACQRHRLKCKCRHPPGDEIYRDGEISIFEVDGRKNKIYCQNLCLLSKMFLDHKSLFYDVEPFLFYVITEVDEIGARFVGYFSKEKRNTKDLNLSCIMTLPVRQRQGWGNLLIDFSYLLSKKEGKCGTPERPLSALGAIGYQKYWTLAVMRYLQTAPDNPRLEDISAATSLTVYDIYNTLVQQEFISIRDESPSLVRPSPGRSIKFSRRKSGNPRKSIRVPPKAKEETKSAHGSNENNTQDFVPPSNYVIQWDREKVTHFLRGWEERGYLILKHEKLKWTPFLLSLEDMASLKPTLRPTITSSLVAAVANIVPESIKGQNTDVDVLESTSNHPELIEPTTPKDDGEQVDSRPSERRLDIELTVPAPPPAPQPAPSASLSTPVKSAPRPRSILDELAEVAIMTDNRSRPSVVEKMLSSKLSSASSSQVDAGKHAVASTEDSNSSIQSLTPSTPISPSRSQVNGRHSSRRKLRSQPSPDVVIYTSPSRDTPVSKALGIGKTKVNGEVPWDTKTQFDQPVPTYPPSQSPPILSLDTEMPSTPKEPLKEPNGNIPSFSAKKRRKHDSPPLSPNVLLSPDRPTTRRQAQAIAEETARNGRQTRSKASRIASVGMTKGLSTLRVDVSIRQPSRSNGSASHSHSKPSRPQKNSCDDETITSGVGGSAVSAASEASVVDLALSSSTESVTGSMRLQGGDTNLPALDNFHNVKHSVSPNDPHCADRDTLSSHECTFAVKEVCEDDDIDADGETDPDVDIESDRDADGESDPEVAL